MQNLNRKSRWMTKGILAGVVLVLWVHPSSAQTGFTGSSSSSGGFGGSSSGSGFTGSSSGSGFSGSSGSGVTGTSGGSTIGFTGSTTGTTTTSLGSTTGTGTVGPQPSNPFQQYYLTPQAMGLPTGTTQPTFGQPLFGKINTPSTSSGGTGGLGSTGTGAGTFSTVGMRRTPAYATGLGYSGPVAAPPAPSKLQVELRSILDGSSALTSSGDIVVTVAGSTVVLKGRVPNERERRLVEGMVLLTPGVHEVRNELRIGGTQFSRSP
jgi:BON domain